MSEVVCGSRANQNNQCSTCGGEGCSASCATSSTECAASVHGQLNDLITKVNSTQSELSRKGNEAHLIYARQYDIEREITQISNGTMREQQRFDDVNRTLSETSSSIDATQKQITNLTDILHDRKPADSREIIDRILTKKIDLTVPQLEEGIQEIRALIDQAQKTSQSANEEEKIREATLKLDRAKNIENDLLTNIR